jgi:hypothetical protein
MRSTRVHVGCGGSGEWLRLQTLPLTSPFYDNRDEPLAQELNQSNIRDIGKGRSIALTDEALTVLHNLNCIALIQGGHALSLLDIEHMTTPMTAVERAQLYHSVARTLLDIVAAILEDRYNRQ